METRNRSSRPRPLITQVQNNTTLWIGHLQTDPTDHFAGQTFRCPSSGNLDNIQVFSAAVQNRGQLTLSLHSFDPRTSRGDPFLQALPLTWKKLTTKDGYDLSFHQCRYTRMKCMVFASMQTTQWSHSARQQLVIKTPLVEKNGMPTR